MASPVRFNVAVGTLPQGFSGTPQELAEAIAARLQIQPDSNWVAFAIGTELPQTDVGPFLLNGTDWYVWDVAKAKYLPIIDRSLTLGDVKYSFNTADNPTAGWVRLDGRTTSSLSAFSTAQRAIISGLVGTTLPNIPGILTSSAPDTYVGIAALLYCGPA